MNGSQQSPQSASAHLRAIRIFYGAILTGAVMFSIIVMGLSIVSNPESVVEGIENILLAVAFGIGLLCGIIAINLYKKDIARAKDSLNSLSDKLNQYRGTLIRYLALCEGPALLGIILYFISGNFLFFILTGAMVLLMLSKAPSRRRITEELALDWQEQQQLD